MRAIAPVLMILTLAGGARADEAVTTAGKGEAPPAVQAQTATQIEDFIRRAPAPSLDDGTPDGVVPREPRKVHGQVGVTVGSGGFRSAYAVSVMPVGQTGTLALAVRDTRYGKTGGGYGRGFGDGGGRRTVGMSLALGEAAREGCRARSRGYEPYGLDGSPGFERARCRELDADR